MRPRPSSIPVLLALALLASTLASAQDLAPPATAVATVDGPMYYFKDTNRTPIRIVAAGAQVRVVAREGRWYKVVYVDPRFGDDTGYMPAEHISLQSDAARLRDAGGAGPLSQRGFLEGRGVFFAERSANDPARAMGDALFREELYVKPTRWFQVAAGLDLRANSHDQVEEEWRLNLDDRGVRRPRAAVRRLAASLRAGRLTVDAGKQFIRWGKADILNPTDRFAPRDYLNVLDSEFLPVLGVRPSLQFGQETLEAVYVPRMTPSRLPLLDQRWAVVPREASGPTLVDGGANFPTGSAQGARWNHTGGLFEASASFFNGYRHLPDITATPQTDTGSLTLVRSYSPLRTYGVDLTIPTRLVTLKGEAALFTTPSSIREEYVLYVVELERQLGEWLLDGGYAGEVVTKTGSGFGFDAERGIARSLIGRASYTVDPRRSLSIEGAVRQDGSGGYARGEYTQALGSHWRLTVAGIGIAGNEDDFIGQYRRNSHLSIGLRLSF